MQQIEWRRTQVLEFSSKGYSQSEISKILRVDKSIISRDIAYLREQSKQNIRRYVDEKLPEEYEKCLVGVNAILKETWNQAQNTEITKEKIQALSLAKDCYSMKLELLTNATVVDEALKFVLTRTEKAKAHEIATACIEKESDDIQGSPKENSESAVEMPTNQTF